MIEVAVREGWEERLVEFSTQDFECSIWLNKSDDSLSDTEWERLVPKLRMIQKIAKKMALNMLKGTLKYTIDDWPMHIWEKMGDDDLVDAVMYRALERDARANLS